MDVFSNLGLGFSVALTLQNLVYCFIGALLGTLVGVLPGIGPVTTVAMLLPISFTLDPVPAMIMLAGIYYGAQYGGSTTAILVKIPGEASSVVTTIDGYEMARQGRAGPALGIAALGSFFAGCVATVLIAVLGAPLTKLALAFGPAEYFSLMVLGLIFAVVLAKGSVLKALTMILCGLMLSMIGSDLETGAERMTWPTDGPASSGAAPASACASAGGRRITAHLLVPGFTWTGITGGGRTEQPPGAWSADQVVDFMMAALERGEFYILCPDGEVDRALDARRVLWAAGDIAENRPPLSRWHPEWKDAFAAFMAGRWVAGLAVAALSVRGVTGAPILFASTGEGLDDFELIAFLAVVDTERTDA